MPLPSLPSPGAVWRAYLAIDDGRQAEVVKDLSAVAPHGHRAVLAQTLVIKAVDLGDLTAFVVAPDQGDAVRIANLEVGTMPGLGSRLCLVLLDVLTSASPAPSLSLLPWPRFMSPLPELCYIHLTHSRSLLQRMQS